MQKFFQKRNFSDLKKGKFFSLTQAAPSKIKQLNFFNIPSAHAHRLNARKGGLIHDTLAWRKKKIKLEIIASS